MKQATIGERQSGPGRFVLVAGIGLALGALASFLLDPQRGRARRARYADQAAAVARGAGRAAVRSGRRLTAAAEGRLASLRSRGGGGERPNDASLAAKVESELFRDPAVPKGAINVNAQQGIVVLRGEVPDAGMRERLEHLARGISGVWEVENLLHLPGEPAPAHA